MKKFEKIRQGLRRVTLTFDIAKSLLAELYIDGAIQRQTVFS